VTTFAVTGAAGFIGSHLTDRLLAEGKKVVGVDDLTVGRIANLAEARGYGQQFTFHNIDIRAEGLRDVFERHRPEVVMHLAAQTSVRKAVDDPIGDASVNLIGLLNVLSASAGAGARKVVFASSGGTI
jgi:UDP-glucose 4-epimerase